MSAKCKPVTPTLSGYNVALGIYNIFNAKFNAKFVLFLHILLTNLPIGKNWGWGR